MAKEETVPKGMTGWLNYGNENLRVIVPGVGNEKTKQMNNVECFNYSDSLIINDAKCTRELNPELPWQK